MYKLYEDWLLFESSIPRFKYLYHVTLASNVESILENGLNPRLFKYERSTDGDEIYCFASFESALWYKNYMEYYDTGDPDLDGDMVIIKIEADSLSYVKDHGLTSGDEEDDAYIVTSIISPSLIKEIID